MRARPYLTVASGSLVLRSGFVTLAETPVLTVERVSPTIGAEVSGVDLRETLARRDDRRAPAALLEHKVHLLPRPAAHAASTCRSAAASATSRCTRCTPADQEHPEIFVLRHDADHKGTENFWHSDVTWRPEPSMGSILRAARLPDVGGDTLFADMHGAYDGLSDAMKERIDGLTALHDFTRVFGLFATRGARAEMREEHPPEEHPVVRTHPETGRKGIYVNGAFTERIVGMGDDESQQLLELLYRQASIPEYQCRLRWRPDTIAFWDNRATQHYAVSDYWPNVRVMERVTVAGDRPY